MRRPAAAEQLPEPKEPKQASVHWRDPAPGPANDTELLVCALVLCGSAMSKEDLVTWANDVLVEAPRLQELGPAWKPQCPTDWSCERNNFGATVKPVHLAIEAAQIGIFDQVTVSVTRQGAATPRAPRRPA